MTRPAEWAEHEVTQLRAEIERLTEEQRAVLKHVEELRAEIERLNCALRRGEV